MCLAQCILCEMWFIPRQDVSADAQKRIFEQRRADVEFLSQLQVDLKVTSHSFLIICLY